MLCKPKQVTPIFYKMLYIRDLLALAHQGSAAVASAVALPLVHHLDRLNAQQVPWHQTRQ